MPSFIKNPLGPETIILAPSRKDRPDQQKIHGSSGPVHTDVVCPFCPGQEVLNQEISRLPIDSAPEDWQIRILDNKFPLTSHHEVIIASPDHVRDFDLLPLEQSLLVLKVLQSRFHYYVSGQYGKVGIFNNHGLHAGASLAHPHRQLVVIPDEIPFEPLVRLPYDNVVFSGEHLLVYCPTFSQWPYELWIGLKEENDKRSFDQLLVDELSELASVLQRALKIIFQKFTSEAALHKHKDEVSVPYNFYMAPVGPWYLRIVPRLIRPAGIELATNMHVNVIPAEMAAEEYREEFEKLSS